MSSVAKQSPVVVWVNSDCLSPENPALRQYPDAPAIYVFDVEGLDEQSATLKKVLFLYECLLEMPVGLVKGNVAEEVLAFAHQHGAQRVVTTETPDPRIERQAGEIESELSLDVLPIEPFVEGNPTFDLKRFSRYWNQAKKTVLA